jgi:hypothetical protein
MKPGTLIAAALAATLLAAPAGAQSDILLRLRSGSPPGDRVRFDSAGGVVAIAQSAASCVIPATGTGSRMMWHPCKRALRAGTVSGTEWDDSNVGLNSWAGGNSPVASGQSAFAFGDGVRAGGTGSVALGYRTTANNDYSVAIGFRASNNGKTGTLVLGDQSATDSVLNQANNELRARYAGGFRFRTSTAANGTLGVGGNTGCDLPGGSGTFTCSSSRTLKESFRAVDGEDVLLRIRATPVTTWSYIAEGRQVRHMGPVAEDFRAAFGLGAGSTSIGLGDIDGVNFAGVQALEARTAALQRQVDAKSARVAQLEAELAATRRQLADLAARVDRMEHH